MTPNTAPTASVPRTVESVGVGRVGQCRVCGRRLTDPASVARGIGPICWRKAGGGLFERVMEADERTWAERERILKNGGEYDLGSNWQMDIQESLVPLKARVSIRWNPEQHVYEVYAVGWFGHERREERVLFSSPNIKEAFLAGVQAGPELTASALARQRALARASKPSKGGRAA